MYSIKVFIAMRVLYPLFRLVPLQKSLILFEASQGRYSSNPKYIYESLLFDTRYNNFEFVWALNANSNNAKELTSVSLYSIKYLYLLATANVLVNDNMWHPYTRKRNGQIFIQTWHGTPLKKIALDTSVPNNELKQEKINNLYCSKNVLLFDIMLSSSDYSTQKLLNAFNYRGQILEVGTPRVDKLIHEKNNSFSWVSKNYQKTILIAPSFRKTLRGEDQYDYFYNGFKIEQLANKFPEYCFLIKMHNYAFSYNHGVQSNIIDVSDVEDITELYLSADALITDYSSAMFDFTTLGRTTIQYPFDYDFNLQKITIDDEKLYLDLPNNQLPGYFTNSYSGLVSLLQELPLDKPCSLTEYEQGLSSKHILDWLWTTLKGE